MAKKMSMKEMMEMMEAMQARLDATEQALASAEEKAKKAEEKAKSAEDRLEHELRKEDDDEFNTSIHPAFHWDYAMPGFAIENKTPLTRYCDVTFTGQELLDMMKVSTGDKNAYWATRELTGDEFRTTVRRAIENRYQQANRPAFRFLATYNGEAQAKTENLPKVPKTGKRTGKRAVVNRAKAGEALTINTSAPELAGLTLEPVARGYMLYNDMHKPVVRVLPRSGGFVVATRQNFKTLEVLNTLAGLGTACNAYLKQDPKTLK